MTSVDELVYYLLIFCQPVAKMYHGGGGAQGFQPGNHHKMVDFTPDFFRSPSYNRLPHSGSASSFGRHEQKRGSLSGIHDQPATRIINFSVQQQDVKLHNAENAWKPMFISKRKDEIDPEVEKTQVNFTSFWLTALH